MAFTFKPAIYRDAILYELPRPVVSVRVREAWDFEQFKVPLAEGDFVVGHSRNGVEIALEGQVGTQAGALKATEEAMFAELEQLRAMLSVGSPEESYAFFLYHDAASGTYRHFKRCTTVRFDYDLSDPHLFAYSVGIHAEDPVIYTTSG